MKILLIILTISTLFFGFSLKKVTTIRLEKKEQISNFKVINNNGRNYIAVVSTYDEKNVTFGRVNIIDNQFKITFKKSHTKRLKQVYQYRSDDKFSINDFIYRVENQLYTLDLDSQKLDAKTLPENSVYSSLKIFHNHDNLNYVIKNGDIFNFYDYEFDELPYKVNAKNYDSFKKVYFYKNYMCFLTAYNEIVCYDYKSGNLIWELDTGRHGLDLLFVEVGIMPNIIISFESTTNNKKDLLYLTTIFGDLYIIDLETGKVLKNVEEFSGNDHESDDGLITSMILYDINGDGNKDIIGGAADYYVYCIDGVDLSIIWEFNTGFETQMPLSLFDINGDNIPEVFGVNDKYKLFIVNGKTGKKMLEYQLYSGKLINEKNEKMKTYVTLCDFDGNGKLNLITETGPAEITIFEMPEVNVKHNQIIWHPYHN